MSEPTSEKKIVIDGKEHTVHVYGVPAFTDQAKEAKEKKKERNQARPCQRPKRDIDDEDDWNVEDRSGSVELPSKTFSKRTLRSGFWKDQTE